MPYATIDELPPAVRHLPLHAQEIFRAAFNAAWDSYGDEQTAFRIAWAAVKRRYRKRGQAWVEE
ncbi:MAG TPA: ChaB family protein [Stellaceae bacterium]|nr:ChaB family protein [Stellaceae bacterium]